MSHAQPPGQAQPVLAGQVEIDDDKVDPQRLPLLRQRLRAVEADGMMTLAGQGVDDSGSEIVIVFDDGNAEHGNQTLKRARPSMKSYVIKPSSRSTIPCTM